MRVAEVMKLDSRLTCIFMQHFASALLHRLRHRRVVGPCYGNDVELPVLQNPEALEQWRDRPFIIQRRRMIVKIIAIFNDFLLFPAPEHWKDNREIHASLLLLDHLRIVLEKELDKVYLYITECPSVFM